ncbi:NT (nucleotidyltransferase) domain and HEPN (higher eukarytoes and prokaryotes nucleotide-binding) domain [Rickettsia rickettsii str. 'Sheila Smith']|uniref:NT (Nucleotidyltransferase) domain and HEPN (Higher eukarytoes and prokaryotes nucleotide-binding) domain n=1 Tax=Rickettsia rickettsii (strain Sheila Smith) TaxID=392021 RepID=A0A0H3AY80_RICRS|nr:NT (nucleotidyltransferase) domain and HEPN (higher eukarytoes and prokaryotes nucleotide-binding) domain [Rickettsia rickettsii str. 'Sheila Smith']
MCKFIMLNYLKYFCNRLLNKKNILEKAYVDARYDKNYRISREQLLYLIERIDRLKMIMEKFCLERINR